MYVETDRSKNLSVAWPHLVTGDTRTICGDIYDVSSVIILLWPAIARLV